MFHTELELQQLVKTLGSVLAHFGWEEKKIASFWLSHPHLLAKGDVGKEDRYQQAGWITLCELTNLLPLSLNVCCGLISEV